MVSPIVIEVRSIYTSNDIVETHLKLFLYGAAHAIMEVLIQRSGKGFRLSTWPDQHMLQIRTNTRPQAAGDEISD